MGTKVEIKRQGSGWTVEQPRATGGNLVFFCETERDARRFAEVLSRPVPSHLAQREAARSQAG